MAKISIPVINAANLHDCQTLRALDNACRGYGVFFLVGHGIPKHVQRNLRTAMQTFFALPSDSKQLLLRNEENHWGSSDRELTKQRVDRKEVYDYGRMLSDTVFPQWPQNLPNFQYNIEQYFVASEILALTILGAIAENLGVAAEQVTHTFQPLNSSFLRLNYYPLVDANANAHSELGIHPHTDAGAVTVLLQDEQAGLEIFYQDGWHLIKPIEDALIINLGDIVQVWSNDRYRAPLHRVIASTERERYSAAFFLNPSVDTVFEPLAPLLDTNNVAKYHPIHWQAFRNARAKGDYQNYGREVQISDYRK